MNTRHVSQVIQRDPSEVYAFMTEPMNLPRWAAGLAQSEVTQDGDRLLVDSPMGRVTVAFTSRNDLGVLDHTVTLPDGTEVYNPLRVIPHPDGAEVIFTIRQLNASDEDFDRDTDMVRADLETLNSLLE
ncbi:polyketide cyclase [Kocuria sp. WRN011]|uniref:SRPBCC family protein n=1 Tax=Kocuria carniphila TaxID=262208 RepID=A0ABV3V3N5_9MICC|nr:MULTISPECIES: SRPBCC family protein [Kocuria]MCT1802823.1 SRPBCC family protein [Kocuria carniphila]PBB08904.1 polyketide cyclase [Kocuria sp. WRN011]PZP31177.1 MAG: SRPBCC family protein [Kocuria rhizophila]